MTGTVPNAHAFRRPSDMELLRADGFAARYVTGALFLAACWSLQRMSPARQFAGMVRRLSGRGGDV